MGWLRAGYGLAMGWLSAIYQLAMGWRWVVYQLYMGWLWASYGLAMGWVRTAYGLDMDLAMSWLFNTLQDLVIYYYVPKLRMAASNTLDCSVFTKLLAIGWLSAGYRLAISWLWPKTNTLQDIVIHYVPNWHMAAINTLDCSVFTRFLGYQLAIGYLLACHGPKSTHFKK